MAISLQDMHAVQKELTFKRIKLIFDQDMAMNRAKLLSSTDTWWLRPAVIVNSPEELDVQDVSFEE